jgi:hypothetical protein
MNDLHTCSLYSMEILNFSCVLTILTHCLNHSTFLNLLFLQIFFVIHFFIFYLGKQHPYWLEKLPMSIELYGSLSINVLYPRVHSCEWFTRPFFLSRPMDSTLQRMEHFWMPNLKVGKVFFYSSFLAFLLSLLIINVYIVRSTFIPESLGVWLMGRFFFLGVFVVYSVRVHSIIHS